MPILDTHKLLHFIKLLLRAAVTILDTFCPCEEDCEFHPTVESFSFFFFDTFWPSLTTWRLLVLFWTVTWFIQNLFDILFCLQDMQEWVCHCFKLGLCDICKWACSSSRVYSKSMVLFKWYANSFMNWYICSFMAVLNKFDRSPCFLC